MTAELITETTPAERLARIEAELDAIALSDYDHQSPAQARETAATWQRILSRGATHAGRASRAVRREHPKRASQVISRTFGNNSRAVQNQLNDADTLAQTSLTEQAAASGQISNRHAVVIGKALQDLPADTTPQQRAFAEKALIRDAVRYSPADLATRARRITDQYKPEPEVDADEDRLLRRREALARAKTSFQLWDNHDGTWSGRFTIPELHGRIAKTIIDAYTAPRRDHLDPAADPFESLDKKQGRAFCSDPRTHPRRQAPPVRWHPDPDRHHHRRRQAALQGRRRHPGHRRTPLRRRTAPTGRQPRHHPRRPGSRLRAHRPRAGPTPVHQRTTRPPRHHGRRMHRTRLRPTTLLVRSPTHRPVETRRQDRPQDTEPCTATPATTKPTPKAGNTRESKASCTSTAAKAKAGKSTTDTGPRET